MLALTRKPGERIMIGDQIVITVVEIKGENIKLAIEAPKDIKIYRGEIYDSIVGENKQAAVPVNLVEMEILKKIYVRK